MGLTVGVDVGGTKIAAGVVDEHGKIIDQTRVATPEDDEAGSVAAIIEVVRQLHARHEVVAAGLGCAGFVDAGRSTVLFAPNLSWTDVELRHTVGSATGLPVVVENDANAAAWAEFQFGAGVDVQDMVCVTVGTGIGGGLVLDGRLYRGAGGFAAELGHIRVVPDGLRCGCGLKGCWEQYASGRALVREARDLAKTRSPLAERLLEMAGGSPKAITGHMVTQAAAEGDEAAIELLETLGQWLGAGMATVAATLDPAVFVVGGGVSEAGDLLIEPARASFRRHLTGRSHRPEPEIRRALLGNEAGIVGAADLSRV
jgi:glucokinase